MRKPCVRYSILNLEVIKAYCALNQKGEYSRPQDWDCKSQSPLYTLFQKLTAFSGGVDIANKYPLRTKNKYSQKLSAVKKDNGPFVNICVNHESIAVAFSAYL